jgi:cell division protein FtsW
MRPRGATQALPRLTEGARPAFAEDWDLALGLAALGLLSLGLVMVASASVALAARDLGEPLYYFWRQSLFVTLGLAAAFAAARLPLVCWRRGGPALLVLGIVLLVLVLIPGIGKSVNGSMRWIPLFGGFNLQPSELAKLFLAVYLAGYLVRQSEQVRSNLWGFLKPAAVLTVMAVLLLLEPDYGATVVLVTTALGMLFLGGVPFWSFMGWMGLVAFALGAVVVAAPYRVERLMTFLNPWADPFGSGFQLTQALIAIGRGEWLGVGLGSSVQKLFYLPEAHTDFLFAVLAEELGLAGVITVIALYTVVVCRAMTIGRRAEACGEHYGGYLAYGLGLLVGLQAFVNIGVNLGILPTKGLTLPLMSYGGSSLVVTCLAVGILLRIDHETRGRR